MKRLTAVLAFASSLAGCAVVPGHNIRGAGVGDETPQYKVVEITAETLESTRLNTGPAPELPAAPAAPAENTTAEYLIGPGDVLSVVVWDHPELTNPLGEFRDPVSAGRLVASDGTTFFPYVGVFQAAGKTTRQIQQVLIQSLSRVVKDPQVDVRVVAFRSQRVQVTGEVRQPGVVYIDDTAKGVLEAINERGGLQPEASRREALLIRGDRTYRMDLSSLLSGARPAGNPPLVGGDIVHVPDAADDQIFVLGEVAKPAPVRMRQRVATLTEVLTAAGGLDHTRADDSGVLVFRRPDRTAEKPQATIFALDMSRPEGMLLASEFELAPRDVVYVKATGFAQYNSVIGQLLPTITAVFQLDRLIND